MAESSGEKTEMPTAKKLRDAREKGQVCTSKDIVSTALLIILMVMCAVVATWLFDDIDELIGIVGRSYEEESASACRKMLVVTGVLILKHSFLFVGVAALVGIVANMAQIGFLFTFEPLKPNLSKLNPAEGFKRIFSMKNFFEFGKNVLKILFLGYLIYKIVLASVPALLPMCYGTIDDVMPVVKLVLKRLAVYTAFGYIVIAAVDRLFQQKNFTKQMMMTKDEVKREYKEMEGSQEVKQAQRQFRDEILNGPDPAAATKKASVVVTNPTHLAVGVRYVLEESPLPHVCVKGADNVAAIIRRTAMEEGIPILENVPLARALYARADLEALIPPDLIEPVAEVLRYVKALDEADKEQRDLDSIEL